MQLKKSKKNVVKLLTSAALALPGIQAAQAESPPSNTHAEFRYSTYDESGERYKINVYQALLEVPIKDKWLLSLKTQRDLQTGASFVFAEPQSLAYFGTPNVNPGSPSVIIPVMTGASIREKRESLEADTSYYFPESVATLGVGYSTEGKYLSRSIDASYRKPFNKKATEISLGLGYSDDEVRPTPDGVPGHLPRNVVESEGNRHAIKAVIGVRQDLSPRTTSKFNFSFSHDNGYLADPYKRVIIYGNASARRPGSAFIPDLAGFGIPLNIPAGLTVDYDRRPGRRDSIGFSGKVIHYIEKTNGAVHLKYSFAHDDWEITSNEVEASYFQPFHQTWRVVPLVRYYTQTEARFYSYMFEATGGAPFPAKLLPNALENSCDNRLSKFGTVNWQVTLTKQFPIGLDLSFTGGMYISREGLHFGHKPTVSHPFNHYTATYFAVNTAIDFS